MSLSATRRRGRIDEIDDLQTMDLVAFNGGVSPYGDRFLDGAFHAGSDFYRSVIQKWDFVGRGEVADVGSGFGRWSVFLAEVNAGVTGFERLVGAVELARRLADLFDLPNARFEVADAGALPAADGAFDAAWCFNVLQFVNRDKALKEIHRIVRTGGEVLVGHYNAAGRVLEKFFEGYTAGGLASPMAKFAIRSLKQGPLFHDGNGTYGSLEHLEAVLAPFGFEIAPGSAPELQMSPKAAGGGRFAAETADLAALARRLESDPAFAAEFAAHPETAYEFPMNLAFRAVKI